MKKILMLLCCFHLTSKAGVKNATEFDALTIKLALHELLDPVNNTVQLGLEFKPIRQLGLQVEFGHHLYPSFASSLRLNESYSKYKVRASWYYYEKQKINMYAGVDFLYFPKEYDLSYNYFYGPSYQSFESAHVSTRTKGFFLVDGVTFKKGKHIRLDLNMNVGLRITDVHYSKLENPLPKEQPIDGPLFNNGSNREGVHYNPHIGFGVRLGYVLSSGKISR